MRWRCSGSHLSLPYGISGIQTAGEGKIQMKIKGRERKRERKGRSVGNIHGNMQGCKPTAVPGALARQ